jgi:hypothetical protein
MRSDAAETERCLASQTEPDPTVAEATPVRWWPAALAVLVLSLIYALLPTRLTVGPPWLLLAVVLVAFAGIAISHWRGLLHMRRYFVLGALGIISLAVTVSAGFLISALLDRRAEASTLLRDAALLWVSNVLTFALLYWELDGGGPAHRHATGRPSTDFAFPQMVVAAGDGHKHSRWHPDFLDYLFLAFNTSTAFSPTDTMVLARRAKALMMWQSIVSLITIAVLAARAINTI